MKDIMAIHRNILRNQLATKKYSRKTNKNFKIQDKKT